MNRVLLINKTKNPTRGELTTCERRTGELLFAQFPELNFAGYIIAQSYGKLAANWIIPQTRMEEFCEFVRSIEPEGYEIAVFAPGTTRFGGQCETRII